MVVQRKKNWNDEWHQIVWSDESQFPFSIQMGVQECGENPLKKT